MQGLWTIKELPTPWNINSLKALPKASHLNTKTKNPLKAKKFQCQEPISIPLNRINSAISRQSASKPYQANRYPLSTPLDMSFMPSRKTRPRFIHRMQLIPTSRESFTEPLHLNSTILRGRLTIKRNYNLP